MASLAKKTPEYEEFAQTANSLKGGTEIDPDWLLEIWTGADCDLNRALNHVLDTDDSKVQRKGSSSRRTSLSETSSFGQPGSVGSIEKGKKKKDKAGSERRKKGRGEEGGFASRHGEPWDEGNGGSIWGGPEAQKEAQRHQSSSRGAAPSTDFSGQYEDGGFTYTLSQDGSSVTVVSEPARPECPASGSVVDKNVHLWGLTGKLKRSKIEWSNGVTWKVKRRRDSNSTAQSSDFGNAFPQDAFGSNSFAGGFPGNTSFDDSKAWDAGYPPQHDAWGFDSQQQQAWNGGTPQEAQQPSSDSYHVQHAPREQVSGVMVDSESESDNEWWHMPRLKNFLADNIWQIDQMVDDLYSQHCPQGRGGFSDLMGVAQSVSQAVHVSHGAFKNLHEMHERYDFSGDGSLDAKEAAHLIKGCLRWYHHESGSSTGARDMKLPRRNLEDEFSVIKKLGQGGQGSMYLVSVKGRSDELRCVKIYQKANMNAPPDAIREEFDVMRRLDSPFVARAFDFFEDRANVYLVNEPYFGGDLTKLVAQASEAGVSLSEDWFRGVLVQPVHGVQYINQHHLMHCDLKEANVMVANDSNWNQPHVMIIDVGLAVNFVGDTTGICGTPGYIPPETWQKRYWIPKGDVFSLGVMFFQVMSGIHQLFGKFMKAHSTDDIGHCTCSSQPPWSVFDHQPEFGEVVMKMLEKDPRQRPTVYQVAQHSWFRNMNGAPMNPDVLEHIRQSNRQSENEIQLAEMMLDRFNIGSLHHLSQAFHAMDRDMCGVITVDEARQGVSNVAGQLGVSGGEIEQLISGLADNMGNVSYRRFMTALIHQQKGFSVQDLWARFCQIDTDRNGVLDQRELLEVVKTMNYTEQDAWALMQSLDQDRDGRITFEEFKRAVMGEG